MSSMGNKRRQLTPILIYCEGLHDQLFVRYIQQLYKPKDSKYYFDIQQGDGGSPESLVNKASKRLGSYQKRLVVCDWDKKPVELNQAQDTAKNKKVDLIISRPCLEATMLDILEPAFSHSSWSTKKCKHYFHKTYIPRTKRSDLKRYAIVRRRLIDQARTTNQKLNCLVELIEKASL